MNVEDLSDFFVGKILKVIQDDDNTIVSLQVEKSHVKRGGHFVIAKVFFLVGFAGMYILIKGVESFLAVEKIDGFIDGDLVKPAEEPEFRIKCIEFFERLDKDRLGNVFSVFSARCETICEIKDRFLISVDQDLKGFLIAFETILNQNMILLVCHELQGSIEKVGVWGR